MRIDCEYRLLEICLSKREEFVVGRSRREDFSVYYNSNNNWTNVYARTWCNMAWCVCSILPTNTERAHSGSSRITNNVEIFFFLVWNISFAISTKPRVIRFRTTMAIFIAEHPPSRTTDWLTFDFESLENPVWWWCRNPKVFARYPTWGQGLPDLGVA